VVPSESSETAAERCTATATLIKLQDLLIKLQSACDAASYAEMIKFSQSACHLLWKLAVLDSDIVRSVLQTMQLDGRTTADAIVRIVGLAYYHPGVLIEDELAQPIRTMFNISAEAWDTQIDYWRKRLAELSQPTRSLAVDASVMAMPSLHTD